MTDQAQFSHHILNVTVQNVNNANTFKECKLINKGKIDCMKTISYNFKNFCHCTFCANNCRTQPGKNSTSKIFALPI